MGQAFLIALSYYLMQVLDGFVGFQTVTRPIILGTVTGLLCGDLKTGIIMGTSLEAIYMGVSAIGGAIAADFRTSTVMAVGLTILTGIGMEEGVALAVTVGALMNAVTPFVNAIQMATHPVYTRLAHEGNVKAFRRFQWFTLLVIRHTVNSLIIFFSVLLGADAVANLINNVPGFITRGLSASSGMLVVVGLCLTTQAIYNSSTVFWVLLGFVLFKYLSLPVLPIAIIGLIISYVLFNRNKKLNDIERKLAEGVVASGGDDFYG